MKRKVYECKNVSIEPVTIFAKNATEAEQFAQTVVAHLKKQGKKEMKELGWLKKFKLMDFEHEIHRSPFSAGEFVLVGTFHLRAKRQLTKEQIVNLDFEI